HHENGVTHGMARSCYGVHAWQEFLSVLVEHNAITHRHQVLAGVQDKILQRAAGLALIGPELEIALCNVELRIGKQHFAALVHYATDVVDMGVRKHHRIDFLRLDAGFLHALLLAAGGWAEVFRGAHAGVEQDQLVAGVHDRRILFQHDVFGRKKIVRQHFLYFVVRYADKGAFGRAEWQGTVGDDGDFGIAETEAIEIGRLGSKLGCLRQSAATEHGGCAKASPEGEQGPSRNIRRHGSSSTDLRWIMQL